MIAAFLWCVVAFVPVACTAPGAVQGTGQETSQETSQEAVQEKAQETVRIPIPEDMQQLADLVAYYSRVAAMKPEEQRREYVAAGQMFSRDPSQYNRIRVALLAAMPGTSFQDDVRATSLLEPYAKAGPTYDKLRQFGAILHAQVAESVNARGRAEQLREQLDALRAIERTIIERGQPAPPAKQ
jgi:hypothetical protein